MTAMTSPAARWRNWRQARTTAKEQTDERPLKPMQWTTAAAVVLVTIGVAGAVALWIANYWANGHTAQLSPTDPAAVSVRLDVIKTALTVAAALGAGATLLLGLRRQSITERAQQQTERAQRVIEEMQQLTLRASEESQRHAREDAAERRITDLYVAAVEQLGSDKAPVRLGGLYALERLGNDNPKLRQTVVDVICAYLRMPFTPPGDVLAANTPTSLEQLAGVVETPQTDEPQRRQELQVRLTAQRLLTEHLRAPAAAKQEPSTYWRGPDDRRMNLDLSGANLVRFNLSDCALAQVALTDAHLHGFAELSDVHFYGAVDLSDAQFHGRVHLLGAKFHGSTQLAGATFDDFVDLSGTEFDKDMMAGGALFRSTAVLNSVKFYGFADLSGAQFCDKAQMIEVQFHQAAHLGWVGFHGAADLSKAQFHDDALLKRVRFHQSAYLGRVRFHQDVSLSEAEFHGEVHLRATKFERAPMMEGSRTRQRDWLPDGWTTAPDPDEDGLYKVIRMAKLDRAGQREPTTDPA